MKFVIYKHYKLAEIKRNDFVQLMLNKPEGKSYSVHGFVKGKAVEKKSLGKLKIQGYGVYQGQEFIVHVDNIYRDYTIDSTG